jgi:hypothetical protein
MAGADRSSGWRTGQDACSGVTLNDMMVRVGRFSQEAAVIYQHSDERQREAAAGLDEMVRAERAKNHKDNSAHHKEESTGS